MLRLIAAFQLETCRDRQGNVSLFFVCFISRQSDGIIDIYCETCVNFRSHLSQKWLRNKRFNEGFFPSPARFID